MLNGIRQLGAVCAIVPWPLHRERGPGRYVIRDCVQNAQSVPAS
jgi:hypothetical protein